MVLAGETIRHLKFIFRQIFLRWHLGLHINQSNRPDQAGVAVIAFSFDTIRSNETIRPHKRLPSALIFIWT